MFKKIKKIFSMEERITLLEYGFFREHNLDFFRTKNLIKRLIELEKIVEAMSEKTDSRKAAKKNKKRQ